MLPMKHTAGAAALALVLAVILASEYAPGQQPQAKKLEAKQPAPKQGGAVLELPVVDKLPTTAPPRTTTITGKVAHTMQVHFGDERAKHLVAWVRAEDGHTYPVDLGPAGNQKAQVKKGDTVTVTGKVWPIMQTRRGSLFFAAELRNGDQAVTIRKTAPGDEPKPQPAAKLAGQVLSTKQVDWRGSDRRELIVLLKTGADKQVIADLGPTAAFKDATVKSGSDLNLRGRFREFGDRKVFFATEATVGNKTVKITRDVKPESGDKPADNQRVLNGTIRGIEKVKRKEGGAKHLVLLVRGEDGKYALADLGAAKKAKKYDLEVGDRVTVTGQVVRIQDRPVILADSLSRNATTHWISRQK
jgi:hypothetical protein